MVKRFFIFLFAFIAFGIVPIFAQDTQPLPTLVSPTLVPVAPSIDLTELSLTESGVARIQNAGVVRVGILFNEPPFGELNIRGELSGFDADLARSIADTWGVELQFVQVTGQNAIETLLRDDVDMLVARQTHRRELDSVVEFTQTYHIGEQAMMVRSDDSAEALGDMTNRRIGYVMKTDGERALEEWQIASGVSVESRGFLNLDLAYVALVQNEIDGIVGRRERLIRVATQPDLIKLLDEPVQPESYAIVVRRQDIHLRNLVNQTLQYLTRSGRLFEIHNAHFPGEPFQDEVFFVWEDLSEDTPLPSQFAIDVPYPPSVTDRLESGQPLRVAGYTEFPPSSEAALRVNNVSKTLIDRIAQNWGVSVEYLPNSVDDALELVATGKADVAVGVTPTWEWSNRLDFSLPYVLHGDRLLVPADSNIETFNGLDRQDLGVVDIDLTARDRVGEFADEVEATIEVFVSREQDIAFQLLSSSSLDAVYGDSLFLIDALQQNPEGLLVRDRWYSREYIAFAVPRNDIEFRLMINYALQDLMQAGEFQQLVSDVQVPGEVLIYDIWYGTAIDADSVQG